MMVRMAVLGVLCFSITGSAEPQPCSNGAGDILDAKDQPTFRVRTTEHFTLHYNTTHETANDLVPHMESTYQAVWSFCQDLKLAIKAPAQSLSIYLFDDAKEYRSFCEKEGVRCDGVQGTYVANLNAVLLLNVLRHEAMAALNAPGQDAANPQWMRERDAFVKSYNRLVVRHEIAHQLLFNIGALNRNAIYPDWLLEGLACLFEPDWPVNPNADLILNQDRLADLRDSLVGTSSPNEREVRKRLGDDRGRLLSLRTVAANPEAVADAGQFAVYRYAQAWMTTLYLYVEKKEQFAGYLGEMSGRGGARLMDADELLIFEQHFGPLNEGADKEFQAFLFHCMRSP
ncbi:MAG: DUF1570 domain-containing protein [Planctomycetota bacterium]